MYNSYLSILHVFEFLFLVIGALLGTQDGRTIEIFNSFELQFDLFDDGQLVINMAYYKTKEEQCELTQVNMFYPCLPPWSRWSINFFSLKKMLWHTCKSGIRWGCRLNLETKFSTQLKGYKMK